MVNATGVPAGPALRPRITVVGIGADGWDGLPERLRGVVRGAGTVLGGSRHLGLVPPVAGQRRETWPSPLRAGLPALLDSLGTAPVVALASGDPMVSGVGTTLVEVLGAGAVLIEPAVSSVALARARMGWSAESSEVVTVVGRDAHLLLRSLAPGHRVLVLSAGRSAPGVVAGLLAGAGYGESTVTVLGDLGAATESRAAATANGWLADPPSDVPALHVLALDLRGPGVSWATGLPDEAYEHDGQLTRRDLRAAALARLAPAPGGHLWDVGAGAGSVGIEWLRTHPTCRATAVETRGERAARVRRNAERLGVPTLTVVEGTAPEALAGLPAPDAVFVGGGATRPGVLDACLGALRPGGRLVVHGVTLETERVLADAYLLHGGELSRLAVESAAPLGAFTGWTPARTVTQWAWTRRR
ncbi:precorrin-6y C5,15-methyltransferase (decarboxylating) subunit CbiE [Streptomyces sp. MP131-18]|uniref:precorrin-6y C5,15-methyltransferase (decarboxylating) subunit CbiE n=1 Tax=Streptomyces sp. MP131-18 TaxID=1857892 RepID=UPI00097C56AD|nr:precorrin-6y C5,15-methyltransferase (decarboxylating) subunit CbiE [Streptomyces sp. MP131-18]ONK14755.1 Precorrin-6Y C(5,15)-methyltransferase (decarboxylating) [Streptomyces sp. MP131-18]